MEENKRNLIHKFLNNEMTSSEEELFKRSEEYQQHQKIIALFDNSKAIPFDEEKVLNQLNKEKTAIHKKVIPLYKKWIPFSAVASILILFSVLYNFYLKPISHSTDIAQSTHVFLPDSSSVNLNAKSNITHHKNWKNSTSRKVNLDGEAYFEVAKGKTFTVKTSEGNVTVLGTKFNVKQRENYFEVQCFEGSVSVNYNNIETILKPNEVFSSHLKEKQIETIEKPYWMSKKSVFKKSSLPDVIADISIQYDVDFIIDEKVHETQLKYTGSYTYSDDLKTVVDILCQSLNLNYTLKNNNVTLTIKE